MTTSPETPQVFQSKIRDGFIRGRRSSVASVAERLETLDDTPSFSVQQKKFTIKFQKYDEIQVRPIDISTTVAFTLLSPHSCYISDSLAPRQLFQQGNKTNMVSFEGL